MTSETKTNERSELYFFLQECQYYEGESLLELRRKIAQEARNGFRDVSLLVKSKLYHSLVAKKILVPDPDVPSTTIPLSSVHIPLDRRREILGKIPIDSDELCARLDDLIPLVEKVHFLEGKIVEAVARAEDLWDGSESRKRDYWRNEFRIDTCPHLLYQVTAAPSRLYPQDSVKVYSRMGFEFSETFTPDFPRDIPVESFQVFRSSGSLRVQSEVWKNSGCRYINPKDFQKELDNARRKEIGK